MINVIDLIGKPFDPDGYGPDSFSCYGLAVEVFKRFGIQIPRTNISVCACREASQKEIKKHIARSWHPVTKLKAPSVLLIKSADPDYADHVAVYIGKGRMIHVTRNRHVVVDRVYAWKKRIIGRYTYAGYTC